MEGGEGNAAFSAASGWETEKGRRDASLIGQEERKDEWRTMKMWMEGGKGDFFVSDASRKRDMEEERLITDERRGKRKLVVGGEDVDGGRRETNATPSCNSVRREALSQNAAELSRKQ